MDGIRLKGIMVEDFCNYRKPSMFLITCFCNWKCCLEQGLDTSVCQNSSVNRLPMKEFSYESIYDEYIGNPITGAVVVGGLEPLTQTEELIGLIGFFRDRGCSDDFVVYTGYTEDEASAMDGYERLQSLQGIVFKFGRYIPGHRPHRDPVLGIDLASDNQYGRRIS